MADIRGTHASVTTHWPLRNKGVETWSAACNHAQAWGRVGFALVISAGHAGALCPQLSRVPVKERESSGKRHRTHQAPLVLGELAVGSGWVWGAPPNLCKAGLPRELSSGDTGFAFCLPLLLIHLSSHIPSLQAKGVFSQKECLWTDLVMTYGLKTAPFSSLSHTHTTRDEASFQNSCLLTSVAACVCEPGLGVHALGAVTYFVRGTCIQTLEGGAGGEGRREEKKRVSKEETREGEGINSS